MFKGLEHTAIASPDPQKLAQWYADHLEFRINFEYSGNYFVRAQNGSMLEIIPSEGERPSNQMKDPGIRHLAIEVEDFDEGMRMLAARGIEFVAGPFNNQGNRLVFFTDCDGNLLHLISRPQPLP